MPAIMLNRIGLDKQKLIFDADGLPVEERVDFAGLKRGSWMYNFLSEQQTKILKKANAVITRSNKAIDIHINKIGENYRDKFFKVINGKNTKEFRFDLEVRNKLREKWGINPNEKVFVYCGSLGEQYCWSEMYAIFTHYRKFNSNSRFLILTGSPEFLNGKIENIQNEFIIRTVQATEVPDYLNVADIAFAIRKPTFSMQGVAPIKLSEYLLIGLPTIASKGIGDTEDLLKNIPDCYLYDHTTVNKVEDIVLWILSKETNRQQLSLLSQTLFSLRKSANDYLAALKCVANNQ
jgi:hypothetical protein